MFLPNQRPWIARTALAAWIALLTLPPILALPVWPWADVAPQFSGSRDALLRGGALGALAASLLITVVALALVRRATIFVWITLPLMVFVPIESWYVYHYGQPSTAHVIGVIAETNWGELREFVTGRLLLVLALAALYALLAIPAAWWIGRLGLRWDHRSRLWVVAAAVLAVAAGVGASLVEEASHNDTSADADPSRAFARFLPPQLDGLERAFPWGVPLRYAEYAGQRRKIERGMRELASRRVGATLGAGIAPTNVILVIGETARSDRFGINGYTRDTTPQLSRIEGLVSFPDAVSATAASRTSIPFLLTRMQPGTNLMTALVTEKSIVSAFSEAGYRTWWISNQMTVSEWDNGISLYAEEADVRRYLNLAGFGGRSDYDEVLLPELDRALAIPAQHRFIVLHTLGSHFNYRNRYPDEFDRFQPSIARGERVTIFDRDRREQLSNAYDNSILYTDKVLADVISRAGATGEDSVLVYIADHGEALFEGGCDNAGHGVASASNFRVPLFVWMSPKARLRDQDAWRHLQSHRAAPVTSGSVFPTLAALGGIVLPRDRRELNLASERLARPPRLVSGDSTHWMDFDTQLPKVDCALRGRDTATDFGSTPSRATAGVGP
ncbi:MAG: phosphoethanolamine transferase [Burkholderiales bacterium]|nr:phosphoethanolamine transferase [Burkholderiales bacterium]